MAAADGQGGFVIVVVAAVVSLVIVVCVGLRAPAWKLCFAFVHALLFWMTVAASFVSGMSLSGDWL